MSMGSKNTFLNMYVGGGDVAAYYFHNYNSLSNTIIGGNVASSRIGIWVHGAAAPMIHSVGFQNYQVRDQIADIYNENGAWDSYHGCTQLPQDRRAADLRCTQANPGAPGFFFFGAGRVTISNCQSVEGTIEGNPSVVLNNGEFQRPDYLFAGSPGVSKSRFPICTTCPPIRQ
jgi:hypothetical protein